MDQVSIFSPKPTSPIEMFVNVNYLDEPQYREFKAKIINFKEFKTLRWYKKLLNKIKEKELENKHLMTTKKTQI